MEELLELDIEKIPLDDHETWDTICNGDVTGCFQIESRLGKQTCKKARPRSIQELSDVIAIVRPGCVSYDTKIATKKRSNKTKRGHCIRYNTIKEIYDNPYKFPEILSLDEESGEFVCNKVINVIYSGNKPVFRPKIQIGQKSERPYNNLIDLKCTADHQLFTNNGWKALEDIKIGERIAVKKRLGTTKPSENRTWRISNSVFRELCLKHYEYNCVYCNWDKASLDVHHLDGNRNNNDPDNLCFLCPNHHREVEWGLINIDEVKRLRENFKLPFTDSEDIVWGTLVDVEDCGEEDTYDISMAGPNHNFIAGGVVVHNCLEAKLDDDKSIYEHYILRKSRREPVSYIHPALEPIMKDTYGLLIYQEQSIQIAKQLAGMSEAEADQLIRKGVAKKIPEVIAKAKKVFIEGCAKVGSVSKEEAEFIFGWIEKGQRYLFNLSHSVSYALLSYHTAYAKTHYLKKFYRSYLNHSEDKADAMYEIYRIIQDAKKNGIAVTVPDIRLKNSDFQIRGNTIVFGLRHLKSLGENTVNTIIEDLGDNFDKMTWTELLFNKLLKHKKTAIKVMISSGAFDYLKEPRKKMLFEHEQCLSLKEKEISYIIDNTPLKSTAESLGQLCLAKVGKGEAFTTARRLASVKSVFSSVSFPAYKLIDTIEEVSSWEKTYLGISLTCSIVDTVDKNGCETDCSDFEKSYQHDHLVIGELVGLKTLINKNGDEMAFASISDKSGEIGNVVFHGPTWAEYGSLVNSLNVLKFYGKKREDSFIVKKVEEI